MSYFLTHLLQIQWNMVKSHLNCMAWETQAVKEQGLANYAYGPNPAQHLGMVFTFLNGWQKSQEYFMTQKLNEI